MTEKEKAKAYDEALEKARQLCLYPTTRPFINDLQNLFPELKESEDERIRKEIIATIHLYYGEPLEDEAKEMIAWLEKQAEQKDNNKLIWKHWSGCGIAGNGDGTQIYLIKQYNTYSVCSCLSSECDYILLSDLDKLISGGDTDVRYKYLEEILKADDIYQISMNDAMVDEAKSKATEALSKMAIGELLGIKNQDEQKPIDKVYEWDTDSKELKKIDQKSYGQRKECLDCQFNYAGECKGSCAMKRSEQKSQHMISAEAKEALYDKPIWNEDDDDMIVIVEGWLDTLCEYLEDSSFECIPDIEFCINWIKSLKERYTWKPSDEQMIALSEASGIVGMLTPRGMHLQSLYNDLKKLK